MVMLDVKTVMLVLGNRMLVTVLVVFVVVVLVAMMVVIIIVVDVMVASELSINGIKMVITVMKTVDMMMSQY